MSFAFAEERFNTEFRYGLIGGPEFSTTIVQVASGVEQANVNWAEGLGRWVTGGDLYDRSQIDYLINFFTNRKGQAIGFRFKAWEEFEVTKTQGIMKTTTAGLLLFKRYTTSSGAFVDKMIQKPVLNGASTPFKAYQADGVTQTIVNVNPATGIVTGGSPTMKWEGEFDRPSRFTTDKFDAEFMGFREEDGERLFQVTGLGIKEIRVQVGVV